MDLSTLRSTDSADLVRVEVEGHKPRGATPGEYDSAMGSSHLLRRRKDISAWPWVKLKRAEADIDDLRVQTDIWNLEHPPTVSAALHDDRMRASVTFSVVPPAPLMDWSARIGSAVANMRSALDSLAWQAAHQDGHSPANPDRLYFPMIDRDDSKNWDKWDRNVPNMNDELRARFHSVAELADGEVMRSLRIMSRMSNTDKHRDALTLSAKADGGTLSLDLGLGAPREGNSTARVRPSMHPGDNIVVGAQLLEIVWDTPFESAIADAIVEVEPYFDTALRGETAQLEPAFPVLISFLQDSYGVLDFVCGAPDPLGESDGDADAS